MCCSGGCQTAQWGENGFCYPEGTLESGLYAFKVTAFGFENHATPLSFVSVGEEDIILENSILVPEFTNQQQIEDGEYKGARNSQWGEASRVRV